VVGTNGNIFKTSDCGTNWEVQSSGTTLTLYSVDFIGSQTGYAVGDNGIILKTTNGGDWIKEKSKPNFSELLLFPNPANDQIFIELPPVLSKSSFYLYNLNGQTLITKPLKENKSQIDISKLESGIYFVKVINDKGVGYGKFIKE
jgi:photosystem II stability/assembly factor-like uncharacterized protein